MSYFSSLFRKKSSQSVGTEPENRVQTYSSYNEALRTCGAGYNDEVLTTIVCRKTEIYRDRIALTRPELNMADLQNLYAISLASRNNQPLHIVDVGGASGAHYFTLKAYLGSKIPLRWSVVETGAMVRAAKKFENDELKFYMSVEDVQKQYSNVDIVYSSGTLQYVPDPYKMLGQLTTLDGKYLVLSRLALTEGPDDIITIQNSLLSMNGPGSLPEEFEDGPIQYPVTYPVRQKIESIFANKYKTVAQVSDASAMLVIKDQFAHSTGYILQRANSHESEKFQS